MADDLHISPAQETGPELSPEAPDEPRPWGQRVLRWVLVALGVVLGVVLLAALLLRTEWGRAKVEGIAVEQIQNLLEDGATVSVERIDGGFLTGARILGLTIRRGDETIIRVDTVLADYNLTTLVKDRLSVSDLVIGGLAVYARQDADSTWNVGRILKPAPDDDTAADSVEASAFTIAIQDAIVRRSTVEAHFYSPRRDSVLTVTGLNARLADFRSGAGKLEGAVDTLYATVTPAARPVPLRLATAGRFDAESAFVEGLLLQSAESEVRASGEIRYGAPATATGDGEPLTFNLDVLATPLAFADVRAFVPVPIYGTPTIRLQAQGTPDDILTRLNAEFEDGATVDLTGAFSASTDGPVRYAAEGTIRDLDPGRVFDNPALAGTLTADLDVDLGGETLQTVDGRVDLKLRGSQVGDQEIQRADLVGEFTDGQLAFTLGGAVPGARLIARGTARPFAEVPRYAVRGELNDVNLAALLRNPEMQGRSSGGTFSLEGRGFDPATAMATLNADLRQTRYGEIALQRARLAANLDGGTLGYDLDADLANAGGFVAAQGTVRPFAEPLAYRVESGRLRNFDLAAVTGDTTHTDLTGTFSLSGSGTDPQTLALDLAANLEPSRYGTYAVENANLAANLRGGALAFDMSADFADAGGIDARGTARPFADVITYQASGTLRNVDLAALTDSTQSSDLTGTFDISGTGTDTRSLALDLRLDLENSRYRDQQITSGSVVGTLRRGDLDLTVDATTPDGALAFTATGRPFDENGTLRLGESTFRGLNLATLLGNPALQTSLNGRIKLDTAGFDFQRSTTSGRVVLLPSTINGAALDGGLVAFDLRQGYAEATGDLDFARGAAAFAFTGRPFDATPTYALTANLDSLDIAAVLGDAEGEQTSVNLDLDVTGSGFDPATMTLDGSLHGGSSYLVDANVDTLAVDFALADAILQVEDLVLESSFADATGAGQIALFDAQQRTSTDFSVSADIKDASPLNAFLAEPLLLEGGTVEGSVAGDPGEPLRLDFEADAQQFAYGDGLLASTLELSVNGVYDADAVADSTVLGIGFLGKARLQFGFLEAGGLMMERGDLDLVYDGDELLAEGEIGVDQRRDLTFRVRTDLNPEENRFTLETMNLRFDDDQWQLLDEATISYGQRFRFRNLLLYSGDRQIAIDGVVDLEGEQNLVLTVENVEMDAITDLFGYDGVGGTVNSTLILSGPATDPNIEGTLRIDSLVSAGRTVGALDLGVDYDNFRLNLDALLTHVSGRELRAAGYLPLGFQLSGAIDEARPASDVDFVMQADSFPVAWAEPFLPREVFTEIGGALTIDLAINGTQADPQLSGDALLSDGALGLIVTGRTFRDVTIPMTFDGNVVRIGNSTAGAGKNGALSAEGTITLPKLSLGELAIAIEMNDFNVIETPTYDELRLTTRDGPLLFTGTTDLPRLVGAFTLESGDIHLTDELTGPDLVEVELTQLQIQEVEATFGVRVTEADTARSVFMQNLALDLDVIVDRNVWLRSRKNPVLDVEFSGTVLVAKQPGGDMELFRTIIVNRGRIELYGRNFDITAGTLTFNGPIPETLVDISAAFEVPARNGPNNEATINLRFAGRLEENPELTLSSEPAMENTDIISYIATGRPAGEAFQGGGAAGNLAFSQLGSVIEGVAANSLGLDVVEIEQRPDNAIVVTFGRYVSSRAFVSASQVVTPGREQVGERESRLPELTLEYQLLRWLQLELERTNTQGVGGGAQIEFGY